MGVREGSGMVEGIGSGVEGDGDVFDGSGCWSSAMVLMETRISERLVRVFSDCDD